MDRLKGKVAIITGGNSGVGEATAKMFAKEGATVVITARREAALEKVAEEIKAAGGEVFAVSTDISKKGDPERLMNLVIEKYGKVDILVNNAGISARDPLYDYDPAAFEKIMDLNVNAVFNCSQVAACIMKEQGGGVILNTSSMVSIYGQPAGCGYPTSKFAVNGMTKSLARELGKDNIRVNAVAPGVIRTDMVAALPESVIQPLINTIPLRRVGEPEDIANAFVFLASDMASYITGVVLSVDGATMS